MYAIIWLKTCCSVQASRICYVPRPSLQDNCLNDSWPFFIFLHSFHYAFVSWGNKSVQNKTVRTYIFCPTLQSVNHNLFRITDMQLLFFDTCHVSISLASWANTIDGIDSRPSFLAVDIFLLFRNLWCFDWVYSFGSRFSFCFLATLVNWNLNLIVSADREHFSHTYHIKTYDQFHACVFRFWRLLCVCL